IGSVTKQFTTAILLMLQGQNKLSLKDKLSKYIPDYQNGDSLFIDAIASHTSGIFNYTNDPAFMATEASKSIDHLKLIDLFKNKPLTFTPGTKWAYSNSGYIILGYIIEKVTGKSYEQVVREMIFEPLQMTRSGFDFVNSKDKNKAIGYNVLNSDLVVPAAIVDSTVSYAAGAIYSTTGDLYKWHKALNENKILSQKLQELAYHPIKSQYGLGWFIDSFDNKMQVSHGGGIFGFTSYITRIPKDDFVIILLNNTGAGNLQAISNSLRAAVYGRPFVLPAERKSITLDAAILKQYEGVYDLAPGFSITVTIENGRLMAKATDQPKFELFAEKENYFFLKAVEAQVEFVKGSDGKIEKMILYQGGRTVPGKKIR
ncbi:MAG TPA: serine hydrolase, partial [Chitinophagaceae bacterium]|nr:serine hydrolase [Chitinophagaceae bacterium]